VVLLPHTVRTAPLTKRHLPGLSRNLNVDIDV